MGRRILITGGAGFVGSHLADERLAVSSPSSASLVDAFLLALRHMDRVSGQAFNIGGGPTNTVSLLELIDQIETLHGGRPLLRVADSRIGDQRYPVSNPRRFQTAPRWQDSVIEASFHGTEGETFHPEAERIYAP